MSAEMPPDYRYETRLITLPITTAVGRRDAFEINDDDDGNSNTDTGNRAQCRLGPWPLKRAISAPSTGHLNILQESINNKPDDLCKLLSKVDEECAIIDNISWTDTSTTGTSTLCASCHLNRTDTATQQDEAGHNTDIEAQAQAHPQPQIQIPCSTPRTGRSDTVICTIGPFAMGLAILWIPLALFVSGKDKNWIITPDSEWPHVPPLLLLCVANGLATLLTAAPFFLVILSRTWLRP